MAGGYAVLDVETTGLSSGWHDRVVEIGVVLLDRDGAVTGDWCTLVNPGRDLGPQHIHGITAAEVRRAPAFPEIAAELAGLLAGRVIVAHNLAFDARFVAAEFARAGMGVPVRSDLGLCTMELSKSYLKTSSRSLAACCAVAGIPLQRAHSALDDAYAAAGLMVTYLGLEAARPEPWAELVDGALVRPWPLSPGGPAVPTVRRGTTETGLFVERIPRSYDAVAVLSEVDGYLEVLDRTLIDRVLSASEQDELVEAATVRGIDRAMADALHRRYLAEFAPPSPADRAAVADLLGLPAELADRPAERAVWGTFALRPGDRITFTGETVKPRELWQDEARSAGLVVSPPNICKWTRVLVAADPDSLSAKARKARDYRVPVVVEDGFARLLAEMPRTG
ncbi:exonuclease domain-containing protein [Allokutzneria albata]|uniref:DNA polymerase-3 subunit epsilon n=1 Tax=Allokutzneria albata TaxID=211114 RepID=A0A1G9RD28_ALLAB|nr:exonuclease domain-containing protein [Allokutzneria albata]SDM21071.1 DNA polymerase-3 subunit epsilon [Allokutzneria albata]